MIIVEDGTIVPDANSYVTRAEYIEYAAMRGVVVIDDDPADVEVITGMDYVESQRFKGARVQDGLPPPWATIDVIVLPEQALKFPRFGIYAGDDRPGSYRLIPLTLKRAVCQVALDVHNGFKPFVNTPGGQRVLSKKIGPLSVTYSDSVQAITLMPIAMDMLRGLVTGGAIFSATTYRA